MIPTPDRGPAPRRVARIGIAAVLVVGLGLQASALVAHRQADQANQQAQVDEQRQSDLAEDTDAARDDLTQAQTEADTAARALQDLRAVLVAAGTSEAAIAGDVATTKAALADLQARIDASAAGVQTRQSQLDVLRPCLVTAHRAVDAAASRPGVGIDGDLAGAIADLHRHRKPGPRTVTTWLTADSTDTAQAAPRGAERLEPTTGPSRGPRRRRAAIVLLVIGALLAGSGVVERSVSTTERREARARQTEAARQLAASEDRLAGVRRAVDAIRGDRDRDRQAAATASQAASDLASLRDQIAAGQATLTASDAQIGQQTGQLAALGTCVQTLDRARDQLTNDQPGAATAELEAGAAACQFAEAIVRGPAVANFPYSFADPYVMPVADGYLAFSTNGAGGEIQMLSSKDSVSWKLEGPALSSLPGWAEPGLTWSPSVIGTLSGYLLFYTARDRATQKQCISTARSAQPWGPYVDTSTGPILCQRQLGGSIDASPTVVFGGGAYLLWKSEGETVHSVSRLWSQQFDPQTLTFIGDPVVLLSADRAWESGVIEGPSMTFVDGRWVLLYSGNHWGEPDYAVGYANCDSPMGPCTKPTDNIVVSSNDAASGPGGAEFFHALDGSIGVAYAGWSPDSIGWPSPRRLFVRHLLPAPPGRLAIG